MNELTKYQIEVGTLAPQELIELTKSLGWRPDRVYNMAKVARPHFIRTTPTEVKGERPNIYSLIKMIQ